MSFVIRLKGDHHLVYRGRNVLAVDLAASCRMLYRERIIKEERYGEKVHNIEVGFRRVRLPGRTEPLALVVVRGLGARPTMILTNLPVVKSRRSVMFIVLSYLRRWQIEETIRFAKQAFQVEDIRIRKYDRLQNMIAIAAAAVHFVAVWLPARLPGGYGQGWASARGRGTACPAREAGHPGSPRAESVQTPVCDLRLPVLRPRRRDQSLSGGQ